VLPGEAPAAGRDAGSAVRALTGRIARLAALAILLAALPGCGDDDPGSGGSAPTPPGEETELTVTLHPQGPERGAPATAEVSCAEGEVPETAACEAVAEIREDAADPVPPGAVCTQIYGGPDLVRLQGTLHGSAVDAELTRTNGCEIDRFDRFLPLLRVLFPGYRPGQAVAP
jgi:hypothetical protein